MYGPPVRLFAEESLRAHSGSVAYRAVRAIHAQINLSAREVALRSSHAGRSGSRSEIDPGRETSGSASPLELRYEVPGNGDYNASERRLAQHC
jgi:hypothetical protein